MKGNEDSIDGWNELMVSPKGIFPGFVSDPCFSKPSEGDAVLNSHGKNEGRNSMLNSGNELSSVVGTHNSVLKCGGSIAERRAAKFGFDVSKISTSSFNSSGSLPSPAAKSPYFLRTPGISPSVLLESPMMLPNLQPSPTTGAFALPHMGSESGMINSASSIPEKDKDSDDTYSFTFNPHGKSVPLSCYSSMLNQHPPKSMAQSSGVEANSQHPASVHPPTNAGFGFPTQLQSEATANSFEFNSPPESKISSEVAVSQTGDSHGAAAIEMQQSECNQDEDTGSEYQEGDQKVMDSSGGSVSTSEDGYSWRKYGQKQVKGSEFPRSYYKCTHPSCPVKKKVEHSHDGQIIEIVYKGAHIHPKPQPSRRSTFNSSISSGEPVKVGEGGYVQLEGSTVWRDLQQHGCDDLKPGSEWRPDGLERACSTSIATGVSDIPLIIQGKSVDTLESVGTPELSSTLASNEEEDDAATTQGSMPSADDNNDNEPDSKKLKMEESLIETTLASRAVREPRVIVQIESEVDILDDGYRWRKYGQKVVKGNPNPRSYYKCTHPGCTVRKHVERASHNLKCVLTTYEGKHNHEVPTARNSSHSNSVNSAPSFSNPHGFPSLTQNNNLPKSEPQDLAPRVNRKMEYNQDYLRHNYLGNFAGGAGSVYQMKHPNPPNSVQYGAFHNKSAPMIQNAPSLSIPPPMVFPTFHNTSTPMVQNAPSSSIMNITHDIQGRQVASLQPFFLGQAKEGDDTFKRPRQD